MARMKKTVIALVFILIIAVLTILLILKPDNPEFRRLTFSSPDLKPLKNETELILPEQIKLDRHIAQGQYMRFNETAVLDLSPEARGRRGIFFTFQVSSIDSGDVRTTT